MQRIVIAGNQSLIPNLREKLDARSKALGEKRMRRLLIRTQIIATRMYYERYWNCRNMDYFNRLSELRRQYRETCRE